MVLRVGGGREAEKQRGTRGVRGRGVVRGRAWATGCEGARAGVEGPPTFMMMENEGKSEEKRTDENGL